MGFRLPQLTPAQQKDRQIGLTQWQAYKADWDKYEKRKQLPSQSKVKELVRKVCCSQARECGHFTQPRQRPMQAPQALTQSKPFTAYRGGTGVYEHLAQPRQRQGKARRLRTQAAP